MHEKHERFVVEYLHDFNAAAAARRAGYGPRRGALLLRRPEIAAEIERRAARQEYRIVLEGERVVEELMRVAFSDIRCYLDADADGGVRPKPVEALSPRDSSALAALKPASARGGAQIRLHSKLRALKALARHVGLASRRDAPDPAVMAQRTKHLRERLLRIAEIMPEAAP